jgi:hypothetical protein
MMVNGLTLPASFVQFNDGHKGQRVEWLPKDNLDAYGNDWHGTMEFFANPEEMAYWSARLPDLLRGETEEQVAERERQRQKFLDKLPGSIPWITDFSHIVEIGLDYTGSKYCLDFRSDPRNPSVICYDHGSWRRVAPDFDTLAGILEPYDGQDLEERDREIERRLHPDEAPDEGEGVLLGHSLPGEADPIRVNGLVLPPAFQAFLQRYPARAWRLRAIPNVRECQNWRFTPFDTVEQIVTGTEWITATGVRPLDLRRYPPEMHEMVQARWEADLPGYLPRITDYSQILQFGMTQDGLPFAFDFRENLQEPSVICMPKWEVRWRRVAPNFETFLCLLEGYEEG